MERAFYNGVLSGMALDGKSFFYVNPLEVLPEACKKDERKTHVMPKRQKWFGCACCPPNISRLLSSVAAYAYTENEDTLFVHMYVGAKIQKKIDEKLIQFEICSEFPWNGKVSIRVKSEEPVKCTLACRIPGWCDSYNINAKSDLKEEKDGYLYLTKEWNNEEEIVLNFDMPVTMMQAHSSVREDEGRLAVVRGPIVYCLEEVDNGKNLHELYLNPENSAVTVRTDEMGLPMTFLSLQGRRYTENDENNSLYHTYKLNTYTDVMLRFVPYFAWNNRGEGEMQVWTKFIR